MKGRRPRRLPYFLMPRSLVRDSWFGYALLVRSARSSRPEQPQNQRAPPPRPLTELSSANEGHCDQALPLLRKSRSTDCRQRSKRQAGFAGVRCAMSENQPDAAVEFLRFLNREFPHDPESSSSRSTLIPISLPGRRRNWQRPRPIRTRRTNSTRKRSNCRENGTRRRRNTVTSCNRTRVCPGSISCWRACCFQSRIRALQLRKTRRRELQQEIEIDPANAGAEYVLGELARQESQWPEAIAHFTRATKLDAAFGDAYLGLGVSLISSKQFSEAVPPLETAAKLEPRNPAAHYNLGMAYNRSGRKQDAEQGICHPSPDDAEGRAQAGFALRDST